MAGKVVGWAGGKEVSDSAESEHKEGRCRRRTLISISLIGTISKHIPDNIFSYEDDTSPHRLL